MILYRPIFIGLTLLFLSMAFRRLYLVPQVCAPGVPCINPRVVKRRRITFSILTVLLLVLLASPSLVSLFFLKKIPMRKMLITVCSVLTRMALAAAPKTIPLDVKNMTCELCPVTVRNLLEKVPGLSAVKVDFNRKTAMDIYDPGRPNPTF